MQIRTSIVTAAILLSTGALAATAPSTGSRSADMVQRDVPMGDAISNGPAQMMRRVNTDALLQTKLGSIAKQATSNLKVDASQLAGLNAHPSGIDLATAKPVVAKLASHLAMTGSEVSMLARSMKPSHGAQASRALAARQDVLQGIIQDLISGLDAVIPQVEQLLKEVLNALGLGAVSNLIDELSPAVDSLKNGLEQLLTVAGDALGPILNPVLNLVSGLLNALLGDATSPLGSKRAIAAPASGTVAKIKTIQLVRTQLASNKAETDRLLSQKSVSPVEAQSLISSIVSNVRTASGAVRAVQASAAGAGTTALSRRQTALPDLSTAVAGLIEDLNALLPGVKELLDNLLTNLGLDAVKQLVDQLEPALVELLNVVENLVQKLADALSPLVDPLLNVLSGLVGGLGGVLSNLLGTIL
ncbi:hypothetical protein OC844_006595 [Tilletia horrida]|nr:hypothetical protein OC844_006595 [Tilletia horrida]